MKRGRKLKLSKEIIKSLEDNISLGVPVKYAVELAGITEQSYYTYIQRAEEIIKSEKEPSDKNLIFIEFFESIKKARAKFVQRNVANIQKHGQNTWQCSAWLLERYDPENFGAVTRITGDKKNPIQININTVEENKRIKDEYEMLLNGTALLVDRTDNE